MVSAIFHYLGPSLAVLLFARVDVLGVAWLRVASAAIVFVLWRRPWRLIGRLSTGERWNLLTLGLVLAVMNSAFYLAVDRLPLSTVGAIEFLGTVILAAAGARTRRNTGALLLTTAGVVIITSIRITGQPLGFVFAFANCALFMLYIVLGHRMANDGGRGAAEAGRRRTSTGSRAPCASRRSSRRRGGWAGRCPPSGTRGWLLAGAGVGVCSSVIPYVTDQLAMARLPRATFSLMLALLPVFATVIGAIVLRQIPTVQDVAGITLVVLGVAIHQETAVHQKTAKGTQETKQDNEREQRGLRTAGIGRAEGIPDLPGHDELRQLRPNVPGTLTRPRPSRSSRRPSTAASRFSTPPTPTPTA